MGVKNPKIQSFLDNVCAQIKNHEIHEEIRIELENHITEMAEDYLEHVIDREMAVDKAIAQMGDANLIGKKLDQVHRPRPEWSILVIAISFIALGLTALYYIQAGAAAISGPVLFTKSLIFVVIGVSIATAFYFLDYRKLKTYSPYFYLGTLLVMLFLNLNGQTFNGKLFLHLGPFNINFVQISPYLFVLALAGIYDHWDWESPFKLVHGLALFIVPLLSILAGNSFSAAIIFTTASLSIQIVSGISLRHLLAAASLGIGVLLFLVLSTPYRLQRLLIFINPGQDPLGSGYLNLQLHKIINNSGFFGKGPASPLDTAIPEIHTDFIFSFITHAFGWLTAFVLVALVIMFIIRMARLVPVVKNNYAKLIITGFIAIFASQFLWHILMNLGAAPISGVGLPFISYGGSQSLMNMAAIGLISSIHRRKSIPELKQAQK